MNTIITILSFLAMIAPERGDSVVLPEIDIVASVKMPDSDEKGAYSVTTVSRAALENRHVNSVKELTSVVPNFYQPDYGSRMTSSVYVRGFGSRIDQPVVGMNIDEVPVLNKNNYDFDLFDIDRVQVVRGAQGALYGRNTTGGAINVYTLSPMHFQGKRFTLEYGNANSIRVKASHYAAPSKKFGWSSSVYYSHSDGFFMNKELGVPCDGGDNVAMRLRAQWLPSDHWSLDNTFTMGYADEGGWAYRQYAYGVLAPVAYNDPCSYRRFNISDGFVVKRFFDGFTLSSTTGLQYIRDRMRIDNDFLPLEYFSMGQYQNEYSVTQEFVARSKGDGAFSWMGGLYGFYKHLDMQAPVTFKQYGIDNLILKNANEYWYHLLPGDRELSFRDDSFTIYDDFIIPTYGAAAFVQLGYNVGEFELSAGLRLDYEKSSMDYDSRALVYYTTYKNNNDYFPMPVSFKGNNSLDAVELLPSLSLAYNKDWGSLYASARKGFKAGGFNTQLFSDILQSKMSGALVGNEPNVDASSTMYRPETNWTYELGTHLSPLSSGALKLSVALFYIDCRDQQLTVFPKGMGTGRMMSNAGESFSYGAEASIAYKLGDVTLNASYGYTHAEFREYLSGDSVYSGNIVPYAPRETMSANIEYRLPVSKEFANFLLLNVGWSGVGRIYWNEKNTLSQAFYGLLSASLTWEKGAFGASLWGKNLLDEQYNTFYFRSIGNDFFAQGKPLQLGVSLHINL